MQGELLELPQFQQCERIVLRGAAVVGTVENAQVFNEPPKVLVFLGLVCLDRLSCSLEVDVFVRDVMLTIA